jgi:preprotein translocase subunit SecE
VKTSSYDLDCRGMRRFWPPMVERTDSADGRLLAANREELRKCTWPTWTELKGSTVVIIVAIFIMGVFTFVVDRILFAVVQNHLSKHETPMVCHSYAFRSGTEGQGEH